MTKKSSTDSFIKKLNELTEAGKVPEKYRGIMGSFYENYKDATRDAHLSMDEIDALFLSFLGLIMEQFTAPHPFESYHHKIREPFDYYKFSLDFIRPLVDKEKSQVIGENNLREVRQNLTHGENVIFLANHQTETDPQAISVLLEKDFADLGEQIIYVAGERVTTDPLAIPFSMGCDLLCIYSKKYIDNPLELKHEKQLHNKRTMELMSQLLSEGGKMIYVAPSGGRDRPDEKGNIDVAPFDPASIQMFYLMAQKADRPTHFYPLALATYAILPPPNTVQVELGEVRSTQRVPIAAAFGEKIDMESICSSDIKERSLLRKKRAEAIWYLVNRDYLKIMNGVINA